MKVELDKFPAMKNLADDVRQKALEYAANLGARGPRPTTVLGTAVTLAREWKSGRLPARPAVTPFLVQPRQGRWIIKRSNEAEPTHTFMRKDDAVRRAQQLARAAGGACFVFGPGGTLIERYEARTLAELPELALVPEPVVEAPAVEVPVVEASSIVEAPMVEAASIVEAPVVEVAPVIEPIGPNDEDEGLPQVVSDEEPIRVKKLQGKWAIIIGDGRTETQPSRPKAVKRAKELAAKLGRAVVIV